MLISIDQCGTCTDFWAREGLRRFHTKVLSHGDDPVASLFDGLQELSAEVYGLGDLSRLLASTQRLVHATRRAHGVLRQRHGPRLGLVCREGPLARQLAAMPAQAVSFETLVGGRIGLLDECTVTDLAVAGSPAWAACGAQVSRVVAHLEAQGAERIVLSLGSRAAEAGFMQLALRGASQHLLGSVPLASAAALCADADLPRAAWTGLVNAFLHPALEQSLYRIEDRLQRLGCPAPLLVVGSDGLAARIGQTAALRTCDAGAQAGLRGAAALAQVYDVGHLAALEVGASRTHFGVVVDGRVPLCGPSDAEDGTWLAGRARLRSLAVGGHSELQVEAGRVRVGPGSTGARPGPACWGHGGRQATLTDVKLVQGQIQPRTYFAGRLALHVVRAEQALMDGIGTPLGVPLQDALDTAEKAWIDTLAGALKSWVLPQSVLCAFGSAGPLAACAVADALGLRRVLVPGSAAVFGASVLGQAEWGEGHDLCVPGGWDPATARRELAGLVARAQACTVGGALPRGAGGPQDGPDVHRRWWWAEGSQAHEVDPKSLPERLVRRRDAQPAVLSLVLSLPLGEPPPPRDRRLPALAPRAGEARRMRLGGRVQDVPMLLLGGQPHGACGEGPAVIEDDYFTLPVPAGWQFRITLLGDIDLRRA